MFGHTLHCHAGLSRASTTCSGSAGKDVDGRHKAGHDSGNALHVGE